VSGDAAINVGVFGITVVPEHERKARTCTAPLSVPYLLFVQLPSFTGYSYCIACTVRYDTSSRGPGSDDLG